MILDTIILLSLGAFVVLFMKFSPKKTFLVPYTALFFIALSILRLLFDFPLFDFLPSIDHMIAQDNYSKTFVLLILIFSFIIILSNIKYPVFKKMDMAECFSLILFSLTGMIVMITSINLIMLFVGIEIMSLSYYVLVGIEKKNPLSNEASIKYVLMGAFSTALFLLGVALGYGAYKTFDYVTIASLFQTHNFLMENGSLETLIMSNQSLMYLGLVFILSSFLFKMGSFPFHFWLPDIYYGAPTFITSVMNTVVKIASVATFLRICFDVFTVDFHLWSNILLIVGILSVVVGNLGAFYQDNLKKLLAYSSISHVGFILAGLFSRSPNAPYIIYFYLLSYGLASILIFNLMMEHERKKDGLISSFSGMLKNNKLDAILLLIALLSLAGIPISAGFVAKFYIIKLLFDEQAFISITIIILSSVIGIYYYIRVVNKAFQKSDHNQGLLPIKKNYIKLTINCILAALIIFLGTFPQID